MDKVAIPHHSALARNQLIDLENLTHEELAWIPTVKVSLTFQRRKSAGAPVFIEYPISTALAS